MSAGIADELEHGVYLRSCIVDDLLCGQITFVANKQLVDRFAGISIDFLKPLFDVVKRLLICDVVNHDDAMCAAIITEKINYRMQISDFMHF